MLTGENGIITKAIQAKEDTLRESAREKIEMALLEYKINTQENKKNTITLKEVIEKIEGLEFKEPEECDSFPITVVVDGFKFEIDEDLNVTYIGKGGQIETPTIKIGSYEKTQNVDEIQLEVEVEIKDEKGI